MKKRKSKEREGKKREKKKKRRKEEKHSNAPCSFVSLAYLEFWDFGFCSGHCLVYRTFPTWPPHVCHPPVLSSLCFWIEELDLEMVPGFDWAVFSSWSSWGCALGAGSDPFHRAQVGLVTTLMTMLRCT